MRRGLSCSTRSMMLWVMGSRSISAEEKISKLCAWAKKLASGLKSRKLTPGASGRDLRSEWKAIDFAAIPFHDRTSQPWELKSSAYDEFVNRCHCASGRARVFGGESPLHTRQGNIGRKARMSRATANPEEAEGET